MRFIYSIYGLSIGLPFQCPGLAEAASGEVPDITVEEGDVPRQLEKVITEEGYWQIGPGKFLLRGGLRSGRFLVENGARITLQKNPAAEEERLAVHFLSSVLAVLLQQRGMLVLHANAAVIPRGAVVIAGLSGAGKTTTLASLVARGFPMLADDITVLGLGAGGRVEVLPGAPHLHLCQETADELGYDISDVPRYPWRRMKASVPVKGLMATSPTQLGGIYLLSTEQSGEVTVEMMTGTDKFIALQQCFYGPLIPPDQCALFTVHSAVLEQTPVYRLRRPEAGWSVNDVVEAILNG